MQTVRSNYEVGTQVIFWAYSDPSMADADKIFPPGQLCVVAAVNEDGCLQCFPVSGEGQITSYEGDTLFPEEVIAVNYAPKLKVEIIL